MEQTNALLVTSAFAFVLAAVLTCLLLLKYGFTRDADAPIGRWGLRPARIGHALAAALFGGGLVLAVIALTAAPLSGRENHLTEQLRDRVERLRARLGSVKTVVDHLTERTETVRRLVFPEPRSRASGDAPAVGLVRRDPQPSSQPHSDTPAAVVLPSTSAEGVVAAGAPAASSAAEPPIAVSAPPAHTSPRRPTDTVRPAVPEPRSASIVVERPSSTELWMSSPAADRARASEIPPQPEVRPPAVPAPQSPDGRQRGDDGAANTSDPPKRPADRERDSDDREQPGRRGKQAQEDRDTTLAPTADATIRIQGDAERRDGSPVNDRRNSDDGDKDQRLGRSEGSNGPGSSQRSYRQERADLLKRPERLDTSDRRERIERLDRVDRIDRPERVERPERPDRPERLERLERVERVERIERPERRGR